MNSRRVSGWMALSVAVAVPAFAHQGDRDFDSWSNSEYDYAQVISVDPMVREVRVSVPHRECYNETRYVPVDSDGYGRGRGHASNAAGGMILGGLLGAVIGHQIDDRHSRGTAAIAGAVIGSAIGHEVAEQGRDQARDQGREELRAVDSEHCEVRSEEHIEQRVDGYRVTYTYN